ncbi:hypothetical protein DPEC_G00144810 [Dallia pectoralis]|uniref:Uncharacterized protein n=1 Tax=Dallia pectoralis TaxID=75939 RepID=A0ACC2GNY0_DALPE|nr:hypothetical protein DPEC_G00144810 [Dallia pectoralis]
MTRNTMTMNTRRTVTNGPLDLCTRTRERGSGAGADRTPAGTCRFRDHPDALYTRVASPIKTDPRPEPPEHPCGSYLVTDTAETGSPEAPGEKHPHTATSLTRCTPVQPKCEAISGENRTTDRSRLPFRKRPYNSGPDTLGQTVDRLLSPDRNSELLCGTSPPKVVKSDRDFRGSSAPVPHRPDPSDPNSCDNGQHAIGPVRPIQPHHPYCYPILPWTHMSSLVVGVPVSHLQPSLPHPRIHLEHTEHLLADVTLATRQDDDGDTALHIAVVQGEEMLVHRMIQLLGLAHKDLDIYNNLRQTPLHLAVITHQPQLVETLLRAGADPGALDRNGQTAVHLCCEHGQQACLFVVLRHNFISPCLEVRNYEGLTPLHLAVQGGHKKLARMLLEAGADINAMDIKSGRSPLIHAVENNSIDMVDFLIESDCNVNGQSYSGNTALHSACGRGQVDTVRLLLKNRADSSMKNYHNDTPAMVSKNKRVTDVLRGRGSRNMHPKAQEQQCVSFSPHRNTLHSPSRVTGSPNHRLVHLPAQMAPPLRRSKSHSPRAYPTPSPHSQSAESLSGSQSPVEIQEEQLQVRLGSNGVTTVDMGLGQRRTVDMGLGQRRTVDMGLGQISAYPLTYSCLPALPHQSLITETQMEPILTGNPSYLSPGLQRHLQPEHHIIILHPNLPPPVPVYPVSQIAPGQSRPSSRCSDQSDVSTMSISSSGGKGES